MIPRFLASTIQRLAKGFPVIVLTGPRQSGKTTLVRAIFPDKPYLSLENPGQRLFANDAGSDQQPGCDLKPAINIANSD